jgi:hypothetical protein
MSNPTIKINPAKPCELEFDVTIQGLEDSTTPTVRFVLGGSQGFECSFPCDQNDDSKWVAKMPALPFLKDNSVKFRVEVIVDGYYFEPAMGVAYLVTDPSVKFQPSVTKPTVTTSFTVKQEGEPKAEEDEQVTAQYAGDNSPTNALLKPEFEPKQGSVKTAQATKDDEHIDHTRIEDISSHVTPGETTDPEPQHGNNREDEGDEEDFDPKRVAESIVKNTFGGVQKPETRGTLFKRDGDGKAVVEGLDSPAKKAQKIAKAARVKEILGTK